VLAVGSILDPVTRALYEAQKLNVDLFFGALLSNATTPDYRILVKRDRGKAHYAISERSGIEGFDEQS